ncbi:Acetylornithine deacetylase [bioreactor metagenome]|uniref:Acetylornithine deacetylase n=1 Tax=bioreactor metagenome TaxID=1076179 RepID=A0A645E7K3_9ZZZZ
MISGGAARNVVADNCRFTMDIRLVRGMTAEDALENVRAIIYKLNRNDPAFRAKADFMARYTRPTVIENDNPLVQSLLNNNKIVGQPSECRSFISPGDCWHFLKDGVTALMCGPGCLNDIHQSNEYAYVSEITAAAKVYALSAIDLCGLV